MPVSSGHVQPVESRVPAEFWDGDTVSLTWAVSPWYWAQAFGRN